MKVDEVAVVGQLKKKKKKKGLAEEAAAAAGLEDAWLHHGHDQRGGAADVEAVADEARGREQETLPDLRGPDGQGRGRQRAKGEKERQSYQLRRRLAAGGAGLWRHERETDWMLEFQAWTPRRQNKGTGHRHGHDLSRPVDVAADARSAAVDSPA